MSHAKKPSGSKKSGKEGKANKPNPKTKKLVEVKVAGPKPDFTPRENRMSYPDRVEQLYNQSCTLLGKLIDGLSDVYGIKTDAGTVILNVETRNKPAIFVAESTVPGITPDKEMYIPVSTLYFAELRQITGNSVFSWQSKVHAFVRAAVLPFLGKMTVKPEPVTIDTSLLTDADREAITMAQERRERKGKKKFLAKKAAQEKAMVLLHMKNQCLPVSSIAHGKIGYADLSSSSGELIVNFYVDDADRKARIEHMGESHMLVLAGIKKGDTVFASCVVSGVSPADRLKMSEEDYRKRSVLAEHIREQIEARGVRFVKKQTTAA